MKFAIPFLFVAGAAFADCPPVKDYASELSVLLEAARAAENDMAGREISNKMWQVWLRAPDEAAQTLLNQGLRQRESYDYLNARSAFDKLVTYCPDYAEGYNQRAFIAYLTQDFDAALADLDKTLAINADHVGAQAGRALTLLELGRLDEARAQLIAALANNPWLSERFLLADGGPLALPGEDI